MRTTLAFAIASLLLAVTHVYADSAEETARRFVVLAYEGRSAELPRSANATTEAFERNVRNSLRVRCVRAEPMVVRVDAAGEGAAVELDVVLFKTDRQVPDTELPPESMPLRVKLEHVGERWLVSSIEWPDDELAQQLADVTPTERDRLLREHPERITRGLTRAVYAKALAMLNRAEFARAGAMASLTRELALASADRGGEALAYGVAAFVATSGDTPAKETARLLVEGVAIAESVGEPDVLARAWYNRGRSAANHLKSREDYRKALQFAERAEDPTLLIRVLYSLANIAANAKDNLTARRYIDRCLSLARELGDVVGEMGAESILTTIYYFQNDSERALFHHSRALEIAEAHHLFAQASLLLRSGQILFERHRYDEARAQFEKVFTRDEHGAIKMRMAAPTGNLKEALLALSAIEAETGDLDEAECLAREAARSFGGDATEYLYVVAPHPSIRASHAATLRVSLPSTDPPVPFERRLVALEIAARAYRGLGEHDRALATILEAIEEHESVTIAGDERQRVRASDPASRNYKLAAEIALDRGQAAQALAFLERGRAIVLTDILEHGRPAATAEIDAAIAKERKDRELELARLSIESAGGPSDRLRQARAAYATFLDGIRARSERRLAARKYADAESLGTMIEHLPSRTVAVEYLVTERQLHVFVGAAENQCVRHRTVPIERAALEEAVRRFADGVAQRRAGVRAPARELYDVLIRPIEDDLSDADALLVVPDDVLWRVPFAALVDPRGRYLLERAAIAYAPSMTAYALLAETNEKKRAQPRPSLFVGVANPVLDRTSTSLFTSLYRDATLDPLPDAEREVAAAKSLYGRSVVLDRSGATEARTKSMLGEATVVHFATHGIYDNAQPMYSRLALARDDAAPDDGWLEAWEIMHLDLDADLVILSACDTARGRIGDGEGVMGMAWSFIVAGARSTVATQWKVGSRSSADLMIAFHRALRAHDAPLRKARSLRQAQLQMLRDERTKHPFHWVAFVIFGDAS